MKSESWCGEAMKHRRKSRNNAAVPKPLETKRRPAQWVFPPDIFWISPMGQVIEGIGHLSMIQGAPKAFGFYESPQSPEEIDQAFTQLWRDGWVRGRFAAPMWSFHMEKPRQDALAVAQGLVRKFRAHGKYVEVDFALSPNRGQTFTVEDFLAEKWPSAWRLNPARRRKARWR